MDITKIFHEPSSFINWFVLESMEMGDAKKVLENCILDGKKYNLEMTLNGIKLNPVKSLDNLYSQFNRIVEERATEIAREKIYAQEQLLTEAVRQFKEKIGIVDNDY